MQQVPLSFSSLVQLFWPSQQSGATDFLIGWSTVKQPITMHVLCSSTSSSSNLVFYAQSAIGVISGWNVLWLCNSDKNTHGRLLYRPVVSIINVYKWKKRKQFAALKPARGRRVGKGRKKQTCNWKEKKSLACWATSPWRWVAWQPGLLAQGSL